MSILLTDFPDDIVDYVSETANKYLDKRISKEIERLSELLRDAVKRYINIPYVFEISPSENPGTREIKKILSKKLKARYPGLEYHRVVLYADVDEWVPVPDEGIAAFEYRIHFGRREK